MVKMQMSKVAVAGFTLIEYVYIRLSHLRPSDGAFNSPETTRRLVTLPVGDVVNLRTTLPVYTGFLQCARLRIELSTLSHYD